ncbi:DUF368 domain-containing protein [Nitriliruptoraceae bacterium ZYF776]|nr:DUF368 domain-containing protein [Profundirhabdus halotolerans]
MDGRTEPSHGPDPPDRATGAPSATVARSGSVRPSTSPRGPVASAEQRPDGTAPEEPGPSPSHHRPELGIDGDEATAPRAETASAHHAPRSALDLVGTAAVGGAMGAADLVPGFSGGTVALITGIYPRLIANVRQGARALSLLVRGRGRDGVRAIAAIEWPFVVALGAGLLTVVLLLASTLDRLLEEHPVRLSALFLGLVAGAVVVAWGELERPAPVHLLIALAVAVVTFAGLGLRSGAVTDPSLLLFFAVGTVAISAMILPGISGSFILLLLGMYEHVVGALSARDLLPLAVFAVGCVVGLAGASTALNWLLRRYHDLLLAALIGLMAGSARVLWPWPADDGVGDTRLGAPGDEVGMAVLLTAAGIAAVVGLALVARRVARAAADAG